MGFVLTGQKEKQNNHSFEHCGRMMLRDDVLRIILDKAGGVYRTDLEGMVVSKTDGKAYGLNNMVMAIVDRREDGVMVLVTHTDPSREIYLLRDLFFLQKISRYDLLLVHHN